MGLMQKLLGGSKSEINQSAPGPLANTDTHSISKQNVLGNTSLEAISPTHCDFTSIQSVPVLAKPRYFNKKEAAALQELSRTKQEQLAQARTAYKALRGIDAADTELHTTHRQYQGKLAGNEVQKLTANAKLAEKLHGLRPQYQQLSSQVDIAESNAANRINAIRQSYGS